MKKLLSLFLTLAMLFGLAAVPVFATESTVIGYAPAISEAAKAANAENVAAATEITATTAYDASVTYWKISTAEGFLRFAQLCDGTNKFAGKTVYLTANIDLSFAGVFTPVAPSGSERFSGTFDGQGYAIDNVEIVSSASMVNGSIFGLIENGTIKNLVVGSGVLVHAKDRSHGTNNAAVCSQAIGTRNYFTNIYSAATVIGVSNMTAGIVALDNAGTANTLSNVTNAGNVCGNYGRTGGLIGRASYPTVIENCRNIGSVTGGIRNDASNGVGGFIGGTNGNNNQTITITNCINNGSVIAVGAATAGKNIKMAGFVGTKSGSPGETVVFTNCYNYGTVTPDANTTAYGLADTTNTANTFTNSEDRAGQTDATLATAFTYLDAGYQADIVKKVDLTGIANILNYSASATDTKYMIDTPAGLVKLAEIVNGGDTLSGKTIYLGADINMVNVTDFTPIGNTADLVFSGTFDGQGHVIDNLVVKTTGAYVGLFGKIKNASVCNVVIGANSSFSATSSVANHSFGSIAGLAHGVSTIYNVYSAAAVIENKSTVGYNGGILGSNYMAGTGSHVIVRNATYANATDGISSTRRAGGIMGYVYTNENNYCTNGVYIFNCHNTGKVSCTNATGDSGMNAAGILGHAQHGTAHISGCVNSGETSAPYKASILAVSNTSNTYTAISNCVSYTADPICKENAIGKVAASGCTVSAETAPVATAPVASYPAAMIHGYQKSTATYTNKDKECISIRLVGSIDSDAYKKVGFKITVTTDNNTYDFDYSDTTVYSALTATTDGSIGTVAISSIRDSASAFYAVTIKNLSTSLGTIDVKVTPYAIAMDGSPVEGTAATFLVDCSAAASSGNVAVNEG